MTLHLSTSLTTALQERASASNTDIESFLWSLLDSSDDTPAERDETSEQHSTVSVWHQSELRLHGIINSQVDFICRYLPDTTLTFVNDAYCAFFGQPREALLGRSFLSLVPEDQAAGVHKRLEQVAKDPRHDVRIFRVNDEVNGERWIQWVDHGIVDRDGNVVEIQAVGRDVTALKQAERELSQQKEILQTIFDHIPVMIALFDKDGQFELVNQYWVDVLGWTVDEMLQHPDILSAFYPDPDYRQAAIDYMLAAEPGWRDFETVAKNGDVIETTWANVRLSDGRSIGIGQDIHTRKALEREKLHTRELEISLRKERELMQLKERFISTASHQFRTPLAVILTSVGLIHDHFDRLGRARIMQKLDLMADQVRHMVGLIDEVLILSRGNAGAIKPNMAPIEIATFCEQLIDHAVMIDTADHEFALDIYEDNFTFVADQDLLAHVLNNLLSNAAKYSPANSKINMNVYRNSNYWFFSVTDEGIGISTHEIDRLFEPFFRADNARHINGTGLGLAIARQYVELHGGQISVESVEGRGTTFYIMLPGGSIA